jgi:anti-sigma B factor antagonist
MTDCPVILERSHRCDIVTPRGELDVVSSSRLRSVVFDPSLCAQDVLVVDLSQVSFIDAKALGLLLATRRWTRARSAELVVVVKPSSFVARVLKVARLDSSFTTASTRDEALSWVDRSRTAMVRSCG